MVTPLLWSLSMDPSDINASQLETRTCNTAFVHIRTWQATVLLTWVLNPSRSTLSQWPRAIGSSPGVRPLPVPIDHHKRQWKMSLRSKKDYANSQNCSVLGGTNTANIHNSLLYSRFTFWLSSSLSPVSPPFFLKGSSEWNILIL